MSDAALLSIAVDRSSNRPLFHQVYEDLRARILSGQLRPAAQLPPTRVFAEELGLSRSTITAAYDQLVSEGYARGRRGSGIFVCELPENSLQAPAAIKPPRPRRRGAPRPDLQDPRPFSQGVPDMRLFPYDNWAKAIARISRASPRSLIQSTDPFGDFDLRAALADHLTEWRGFAAAPENIIVTAGAAGALELIFQALTVPGNAIALENPGYPPMRRRASAMGLQPVWMPVGPEGADPNSFAGASAPKLIILTPSHQFPMGGAMPLARRLDFLEAAERTGAYIVEDDFDSEFRYAGRPIPAMAGMRSPGRVLYVGSLSKVFAAHLRLGYLVVPEGLSELFRKTLAAFGVAASIMPQRPLAEFIASGEFHRHIRRMRRIYGARRAAFFRLVEEHLQGLASHEDHQAGMTVLLKLPEAHSDRDVARRAAERGVMVQPASEFFAGPPVLSGLLAGFSAFEPEQMVAPMQSLAAILKGDGLPVRKIICR